VLTKYIALENKPRASHECDDEDQGRPGLGFAWGRRPSLGLTRSRAPGPLKNVIERGRIGGCVSVHV